MDLKEHYYILISGKKKQILANEKCKTLHTFVSSMDFLNFTKTLTLFLKKKIIFFHFAYHVVTLCSYKDSSLEPSISYCTNLRLKSRL